MSQTGNQEVSFISFFFCGNKTRSVTLAGCGNAHYCVVQTFLQDDRKKSQQEMLPVEKHLENMFELVYFCQWTRTVPNASIGTAFSLHFSIAKGKPCFDLDLIFGGPSIAIVSSASNMPISLYLDEVLHILLRPWYITWRWARTDFNWIDCTQLDLGNLIKESGR